MRRYMFVVWMLLVDVLVGYGQDIPVEVRYRNTLAAPTVATSPEPTLYNVVNVSSYELLTGSIEVGEGKVVFAPFKLLPGYVDVLSEFRLNIAKEETITTYGAAISWNPSSPASARAERILEEMVTEKIDKKVKVSQSDADRYHFLIPSKRPPEKDESPKQYQSYEEGYQRLLADTFYLEFYQRLAQNVFIPTIGFNLQTFEAFPVDGVDADSNGKNDNKYFDKGWDASVGFTYTFSGPVTIGATFHYGEKRESQEEGNLRVPHPGASASFALCLRILDEEYYKSEAYKTNLFIPAIIGGLAFEWQQCNGTNEQCTDGVKSKKIFTPYVDFNITPQAQFRLGLGIEFHQRIIGTSPVNILPVLQYSLQFATPGK